MNRHQAELFRQDVADVMQEVASRHGLKVGAVRAKYGEDGLKVTVEAARVDAATDKPMTPEFCALKRFAPELVGKKFRWNGAVVELVGINWNAPRYPILFQKNGRVWKGPESTLHSIRDHGVELKDAA